MNKLYFILLFGIMAWTAVGGQTLPPDAQKLKDQYQGALLSMDRKYTASKLEVYRGLVKKYAEQNDFLSAAELQKVVAYLQKRLTATALDGRDELSQVGQVSPELAAQMTKLRDEMAARSLKERQKTDKMYVDNLMKIQKKYAKLQKFDLAMEIQKEIAAARVEDRVAPFLGKWKTIVGSQNEILSLNKDFSAILTKSGRKAVETGIDSFRLSPENGFIELLDTQGKVLIPMKINEEGYLIFPRGEWKLRRLGS